MKIPLSLCLLIVGLLFTQPLLAQQPVMTADEMALIKKTIDSCWLIPRGATTEFPVSVIQVIAYYKPDKTLLKGSIIDKDGRYNNDPDYHSYADSALGALRKPECNPLPWPDGKYDVWKQVTLIFDPKTMGKSIK